MRVSACWVLGAAVSVSIAGAASAAAPRKPAPESAVTRRWLKSLTLQQKVAQMVVIPFYGDAPNVRSREYEQFVRLVRDIRVGGLVLVNRVRNRALRRAEPFAMGAFLNRMQRLASVPLLVAGDFERSASMRVDHTTAFPHAMAFGAARDPKTGAKDLDATRFAGEVTAREARALGVQWILVPVADVNVNPDNPVINMRSYGENPADVTAHVEAFLAGARTPGVDAFHRVLTTAKHFPGHGDTAIDSHINVAVLPAGRARLDQVELVPFRAAIAAGVDCVMTAHVAVPALDRPDVPATLSHAVITGLLRDELKFAGLIATDALEMGGIAKGFSVGDAAVRAVEAGADVILMPPNPEAAIRAVVDAVRKGQIAESRINDSVIRLLAAKQRVGLDRRRFVDLEKIEDSIDLPDAAERAQQVAERAVTLLRNENRTLPLKPPAADACFLVLSENRYSPQGLAFAEQIRQRAPQARLFPLDPLLTEGDLEDETRDLDACPLVVAAAFASANTYRGDQVLPGGYVKLLNRLLDSGKPVALISLGNPFLIRSFPKVAAYFTTYSPVVTSEIAAARAVFGEFPLSGRLPVTIPGFGNYGDGLTYPIQ